jgi:hypothetical protein
LFSHVFKLRKSQGKKVSFSGHHAVSNRLPQLTISARRSIFTKLWMNIVTLNDTKTHANFNFFVSSNNMAEKPLWPTFLPQYEGPGCTPIQHTKHNYGSVYPNFYIFGYQPEDKKFCNK